MNKLPKGIENLILSYLHPPDYLALSATNKRWHTIISTNSFIWKRHGWGSMKRYQVCGKHRSNLKKRGVFERWLKGESGSEEVRYQMVYAKGKKDFAGKGRRHEQWKAYSYVRTDGRQLLLCHPSRVDIVIGVTDSGHKFYIDYSATTKSNSPLYKCSQQLKKMGVNAKLPMDSSLPSECMPLPKDMKSFTR